MILCGRDGVCSKSVVLLLFVFCFFLLWGLLYLFFFVFDCMSGFVVEVIKLWFGECKSKWLFLMVWVWKKLFWDGKEVVGEMESWDGCFKFL